MGKAKQIREHMPVICANGDQMATVDRVEGNFIKLTKDESGQHHWIPTDWVSRVDEHVHLDRPGDQVKREWSSTPPAHSGMTGSESENVIPL